MNDYRRAFGAEVPAIVWERIQEQAYSFEIINALVSAIEFHRPIPDWSFCMGPPLGRQPQYRGRSFHAVIRAYVGSFGTAPTSALQDAARRGDLMPVLDAMQDAACRDQMLEDSEPFADTIEAYCDRLVRLLRSAETPL